VSRLSQARFTETDLRVLQAALRIGAAEPVQIASELHISPKTVSDSLDRLNLSGGPKYTAEKVIEAVVRVVGARGRLEDLSRPLRWDLFELLIGRLLEMAGLTIWRGVHLSRGGRRVQIDLLGLSGQAIYVVECKRWFRSFTRSLAEREAARHRVRAEELAAALSQAPSGQGHVGYVVPIVVALYAQPLTLASFVGPPRAVLQLVGEPAAALPSPPVIRLKLGHPAEQEVRRLAASRRSSGMRRDRNL
jgi:DNA-binding Lrp family transcriptional regulator